MGKGPQKAADCSWMLKHHDTIDDAEQTISSIHHDFFALDNYSASTHYTPPPISLAMDAIS